MRKLLPVVLAMIACLVVGVAPAGAASAQIVYNSLPASGVVAVPSESAEADQFNQLGNEVILTKAATVAKVSVTMVSWACQTRQLEHRRLRDDGRADVPNARDPDHLQAQHR